MQKLAWFAIVALCACPAGFSQSVGNAGTIRGTVLDPSGAAIKGAVVQIQNPISQYSRAAQSDGQGAFQFVNVPLNPYHLTVASPGFQAFVEDVDARSSVAITLNVKLKLGQSSSSVNVEAAGDLVENDPVAHTDVDRELFNKLLLERAG